jgi:hypothetical protein
LILYKYISFAAGEKILKHNSIGFSQPKYFNDPFDLPTYPKGKNEGFESVPAMLSTINRMSTENNWAENSGILSLTRVPTNPLMWAHYADEHKGMVIGIDVTISGFVEEETNLIPAQFGNVVYVSERFESPFQTTPEIPIAVGATHHFSQDNFEMLQRLFLYKAICWSYEEEVRVVKCIQGVEPSKVRKIFSGVFDGITVNGRELYLFSLPENAVQEVYFGLRSDLEESNRLYLQIKERHHEVSVYECELDESKFQVGFRKYSRIDET